MNDKISKLKNKIDKLYQDMNESSKEGKNKNRMKQLKNDLDIATKKVDELEKQKISLVATPEEEEMELKYITPVINKHGKSCDHKNNEPKKREIIDTLIQRLQKLREK